MPHPFPSGLLAHGDITRRPGPATQADGAGPAQLRGRVSSRFPTRAPGGNACGQPWDTANGPFLMTQETPHLTDSLNHKGKNEAAVRACRLQCLRPGQRPRAGGSRGMGTQQAGRAGQVSGAGPATLNCNPGTFLAGDMAQLEVVYSAPFRSPSGPPLTTSHTSAGPLGTPLHSATEKRHHRTPHTPGLHSLGSWRRGMGQGRRWRKQGKARAHPVSHLCAGRLHCLGWPHSRDRPGHL